MSVTGSLSFDEICQRGSIHEADVQKLRAQYYEDGIIAAPEAEALFEINHACRIKDPAWQDFFVEAITDYIVGHAEPRGYIHVENADWLIERITRDGVVETQTELEIVIRTIDKARWSPESLVRFALNAVKDAVISGNGALRGSQLLQAGVVTETDVELLRRIIFAFGGDSNAAVSRAEAQVLFEINDATAGEANCPAWTELFVKAVLGVVMATSGYRAPPREEALRREQWLESRGDLSLGNMVAGMADVKGVVSEFYQLFSPQNLEERELARLEKERREILTHEEVTGDEAAWLVDQINRDGKLTDNEACLLAALKSESPKLHPTLQPLLDQVADPA
jgi:hypothetical protein